MLGAPELFLRDLVGMHVAILVAVNQNERLGEIVLGAEKRRRTGDCHHVQHAAHELILAELESGEKKL